MLLNTNTLTTNISGVFIRWSETRALKIFTLWLGGTLKVEKLIKRVQTYTFLHIKMHTHKT